METNRNTNILLLIIALIGVGVVLKTAETVIVTILVAFLLAYIMEIFERFFRRLKLPILPAVILTALIFLVLLTALVYAFYVDLRVFALRFPVYQEGLSELISGLMARIEQLTSLNFRTNLADELRSLPISTIALSTAQSITSSVAVFVVIFIFATLISYGKYYFPRKLIGAFPDKESRRIPRILTQIDRQVRKYIGVKTLSSVVVGFMVGGIAALFGVEFVFLWGFLGFLFNYIPAVGPFISSIFPALISVIQFGEIGRPIWIFATLISANMLVHNVIEPKIQGEVLNLSLLVVFISLLFWGWLWGHMGVLLAIPMTSTLKIILEDIPLTSSFAKLLEKPIKRKPLLKTLRRRKTPE